MMVKEFNKSDLKDGQVVRTRNGMRYLIVGNNLVSTMSYQTLNAYDKQLKSSISTSYDIVKVFEVRKESPLFKLDDLVLEKNLSLVWSKEEPKEMTKEEIEKALGYPIEIIGLPKNEDEDDNEKEEHNKKPWWKLD